MEIHTSCYYIMAIRRLQCIECTFLQFCILIICFIYGEILHPYVSLKAWTLPEMKPKEDEVRLLLLADPHVEGYHSSLYFFSDILQADSDDYLRFHFVKAVQYANPNGVVFLGDLLDTGETASDSEFMLVVSRFYEIFLSETDLFVILVPGDNDVGGEGVSVTEAKLNRFYTKLPVKLKKNKFKFVSFYSDNMQSEAKADFQNEKSSSEITVFISHFPVVSKYHTWFPMNLLQSNASMSIHGHLHRSQVIHWKNTKDSENSHPNISSLQADDFFKPITQPMHFKLTDSIHYLKSRSEVTFTETLKAYGELISIGVPSCTYRSGFPNLNGIGLLQIYRNKSVVYTVLPLHNRYWTLLLYTFLLTTLIGLQCISYSAFLFIKSKCWRDIYFLTASALLLMVIYYEVANFIQVGRLFQNSFFE